MPSDDFFIVKRHGWVVQLQVVGRFKGILEAFGCSGNSGSIQLETVMQRLAVLTHIELLQRAALIGYFSTPMKLLPVDCVNQSEVHYLF